MTTIRVTESICPECLNVLPATLFVEDDKVYMKKTCPDHGEFNDLVWGDYSEYKRIMSFYRVGARLENPRAHVKAGCPYDCGLCPDHKSQTILAIIDVTNRCNLRCSICFAHAGAAGYLYEPTKEEIRGMLENLIVNKPVIPPAIQYSGGEPTVREDLVELVQMADEMGFMHVEINSNGIRMAQSPEYCRELKRAGTSTVYLQFDGVTPEPYIYARGFNLLPLKIRAIENLHKAGLNSIVLVPVLIRGVNDGQVGDILRFAMEHHRSVRAVNFQPVAFTGRISKGERKKMRITIPDLMRLMEEQTNGLIKCADWFPIPAANPFSRFMGYLKDKKSVDFSTHPQCGMATYLIVEEGEIKPITHYIEINQFIESLENGNRMIENGHKTRAKIETAAKALQNIDLGLFRKHVLPVLKNGDYKSLSDLHHKMILVGAMHFMDPYNFDLERVSRCVIHYAVPDGRIIPFCTMNAIHRQEIERQFARPIETSRITPLADIKAILSDM
ncbi:MAG: radical SAM protein [Candidatus Bathyarchaeota archaeon]|nr:radical SAM protein [Candidatus Bathyarchaeota archaeon]